MAIHLNMSGGMVSEGVRGMEGFVLCEPFDDILRALSAEYLATVWSHLEASLRASGVDPSRFTWGWGHPGYTVTALGQTEDSPLEYFGWVAPAGRPGSDSGLWGTSFGLSPLGDHVERSLRENAVPVTVAGADIRARIHRRVVDGVDLERIGPDEAGPGLELLIDTCLEDGAGWAPTGYCRWLTGDHPTGRIARAIAVRDGAGLAAALDAARRAYTPAGYWIVERAYMDLLLAWLRDDSPRAESVAGTTFSAHIDDEISIQLAPDPRRREWATVTLMTPSTDVRAEWVHIDQLRAFHKALEPTAVETSTPRLSALGHRIEVCRNKDRLEIQAVRQPDETDVRIGAIASSPVVRELRAAVGDVLAHLEAQLSGDRM